LNSVVLVVKVTKMLRNGNIENLPDSVKALLESYRVPEGIERSEAWNAIFEKFENKSIERESKARVIQITFARVAVAASLLVVALLASYVFLYRMGNVSVQIARGDHGVVYLPDSSKVTLNAESNLEFNKNRWFIDRRVVLSGEALLR